MKQCRPSLSSSYSSTKQYCELNRGKLQQKTKNSEVYTSIDGGSWTSRRQRRKSRKSHDVHDPFCSSRDWQCINFVSIQRKKGTGWNGRVGAINHVSIYFRRVATPSPGPLFPCIRNCEMIVGLVADNLVARFSYGSLRPLDSRAPRIWSMRPARVFTLCYQTATGPAVFLFDLVKLEISWFTT